MFTESVALWAQNNPGGVGRTIVGYMYLMGFYKSNMGMASAVGLVLLGLVLAVNLIQLIVVIIYILLDPLLLAAVSRCRTGCRRTGCRRTGRRRTGRCRTGCSTTGCSVATRFSITGKISRVKYKYRRKQKAKPFKSFSLHEHPSIFIRFLYRQSLL